LLWVQSKTWGVLPSKIIGIKNSYVAYCFDQAVHYFGNKVEIELDQVSQKPNKEQRRAEEARERKFRQLLGLKAQDMASKTFMDPATFFE